MLDAFPMKSAQKRLGGLCMWWQRALKWQAPIRPKALQSLSDHRQLPHNWHNYPVNHYSGYHNTQHLSIRLRSKINCVLSLSNHWHIIFNKRKLQYPLEKKDKNNIQNIKIKIWLSTVCENNIVSLKRSKTGRLQLKIFESSLIF